MKYCAVYKQTTGATTKQKEVDASSEKQALHMCPQIMIINKEIWHRYGIYEIKEEQ